MAEEYKQIVDLQTGTEKKKVKKKKVFSSREKRVSSARQIDKIFADREQEKKIKNELSRISRPTEKKSRLNYGKMMSLGPFFIALVFLLFIVFFTYDRVVIDNKEKQETNEVEKTWYALSLTNNEMYYGLLGDKSADPIVLEKVYYNYDQINKEEPTKDSQDGASPSIRLVKRGKESHGPKGVMEIVRSQVMYMEPLSEESKILRAILDYERQ